MKSSIRLTVFVALSLTAPLPCSAAYVRGALVWKCDFTPKAAYEALRSQQTSR